MTIMDGLNLEDFKDVFDNPSFNIPVRYDGKNYLDTLTKHLPSLLLVFVISVFPQ